MGQAIADTVPLCADRIGQGEPLLLLHGGNADRSQFAVFTPHLGGGIQAIALDQRDSPDSPCEPTPYGMADHARDIAAFLDGSGLERVHLFGSSYGGAVAMTFAVLFPERVKSVILGATASARSRFHLPDLGALGLVDPAAVRRFMLETVIAPEAIDLQPELVAQTNAVLVTREPQAFARRMAALDRHDITGRLGEITAPTLVICGDSDPIIRVDEARELAAAIPGGSFALLAGSRHGITLEHRQRTADIVRAFVLAHA
ncbi:alpha/beta fold hydrolase [Novosphingobium sp. fls2-241-R2A-195]|jgi:3-oxoadipate enol-lactonase|uniref:alpha/beta fold hydrolase n=1 Tax=Novosphingobium sp. fls2-241-R2A-195 TaxID=3040296 RepID=UPI00254BB239|nr:alpha/beta fold hydrolase [Novosphingobium sp. fls2-241-R2A-195]